MPLNGIQCATMPPKGIQCANMPLKGIQCATTLDTNKGQIDGFLSQLPFNCYLPEVASVGD